jgi:hypothetical protein
MVLEASVSLAVVTALTRGANRTNAITRMRSLTWSYFQEWLAWHLIMMFAGCMLASGRIALVPIHGATAVGQVVGWGIVAFGATFGTLEGIQLLTRLHRARRSKGRPRI